MLAQYNNIVKGITVIMNMARQYITKTAKVATNICPKAQPIDKTIGVEALDTSLMTQVRLSKEAL